jgi:hypothetical protein
MTTTTIFCDNSRRSCAEHCLRKRYWQYEYLGKGVEPIRKGKSEFPLLTGTGVHEIIEQVLVGTEIDEAVTRAIYQYREDVRPSCDPQDERMTYLVGEQWALTEAIGRAWHATKYESFIQTYEVLDIEREESVELAPGLVWMSRPDLLVRRRSDGALFIVNLKTTKKADERWVSQWPLDMQTLSEVVAVEGRLNSMKTPEESDIKLSGVIILGLLKGEQLQYPPSSGNWYHNSPLIWAWHNESGKVHPRGEWSARYEWADDEGNHRLGKGWVKREIWLHYPEGVKGWVRHLLETDPALLEEQVVQLPPILRSDQQIQSWKSTVVYQEQQIRRNRVAIECVSTTEPLMSEIKQTYLDETFPMSTGSGNCVWPSRCNMYPVCHENMSPDDDTLYQIRVPNHPQENVDAVR